MKFEFLARKKNVNKLIILQFHEFNFEFYFVARKDKGVIKIIILQFHEKL